MLLMFSGTACLFNDSTRLLVLAVESYSSVSLRVNGLRNILGVLFSPPPSHPVVCFLPVACVYIS